MSTVHVVGTGTIGEPLIGLLADNAPELGIERLTFHKRTPLVDEKGKVNDLVRRGAELAVDGDRWNQFVELGHVPHYEKVEAIEQASVVIDCTPAGLENKAEFYEPATGPSGFMAQGSEFGFGKMFAHGINNAALLPETDRFLHIVSCNTHNISVLLDTLGFDGEGNSLVSDGQFTCIRRSNDISQDGGFVPSPTVEVHKLERYGTHHARDAHDLYATLGHDLNLFSSAMKTNTQYMHALHFNISLTADITREQVIEKLEANSRVALTHKRSANKIFSFGRDHGFYGRILSQTVVAVDTVTVRNNRQIVGFCFTPQDGNPLFSTVAAMLWFINPNEVEQRLQPLNRYLFAEI